MAESLADRAVAYLGVPYRPLGRDPRGWDCWGLVRWMRSELVGRPTPTWDAPYSAAEAGDSDRVAALIRERLDAWTPCEIRPGAVALFTWFHRPCHVGLALDGEQFIHVMDGRATAIERFDRPLWLPRLQGCFDA